MNPVGADGILHPVAAEQDLTPRHVFQGRLLGQELAIWRADDGHVNVWENRCQHRGVRLSTGMNEGAELVCQYHEWRYGNRSGRCHYIPAHPAMAPPRSLAVATYPCETAYGLVWSGCAGAAGPPRIASLAGGYTNLRCLPVSASADLVLEVLARYPHSGAPDIDVRPFADAPYSVTVSEPDGLTTVFVVQPCDVDRSVIRPLLSRALDGSDRIEQLRAHATRLEQIRADIESRVDDGVVVPLPQLRGSDESPASVAPVTGGRVASQEVVVARRWAAADEIAGFELIPRDGELIDFQPGAHIDIHLANGLVRQYSLTNGPHQTDCYRIGVKLEPASRGGSRYLHDAVGEGDVLAVSEPRNNFPLRRDASRTILLAGGIGITPLVGMAQTLARQHLRYELHYFARDEGSVAFPELLDEVAPGLTKHVALTPALTVEALSDVLSTYETGNHVYVCGPGPMLEAARSMAAEIGWPDDSVHFEYFQNSGEIDDSTTFEVELARSGRRLTVAAGATLLDTLREAGIALASSCEQGACGTCMVTVLSGAVDHQDVYLRPSERESGDRMLSCVSRAAAETLVLDL